MCVCVSASVCYLHRLYFENPIGKMILIKNTKITRARAKSNKVSIF